MNFLSKLWHGETRGLTMAAFIVGAASLASAVVGVLRDRVLASTFGAGHVLDVYYAAFRVPDLIYGLVIVGSLSAGFIPVFAEYLETRPEREAWRLAENVLSVVGATMAFGCVILALLAPVVVPLTVPGFSPEQTDLTIRLSRIMFLSPFFLGMSAVMGGILQATRRFIAFALAPVIYNLGIIFGALVLVPRIGMDGLAWGVVVGALLHFSIQASVALRLGLRRIPLPSLKEDGVLRILRLMAPRTAGLAVSQLNLVILLMFASTLPAGSVAVFNLANNLQSFPVNIIGISFAVAAFPLLSQYASRKEADVFSGVLVGTVKRILFLILPATALLFLLRAQAVRLVLGAGEFDWNDTIRTATVLGVFLSALVAQALVPLFARAFYAVQNTWTPLWIGLACEACNIVGAYFLRTSFGISGLAMSFAAATYLNLVLLIWQFRKRYRTYVADQWLKSGATSLIASAAIIVAGYPVRQYIGSVFELRTFWEVLLQAGASGIVGVAAFIMVARLLHSPELEDFINTARRKFLRKKLMIAGADEAQRT